MFRVFYIPRERTCAKVMLVQLVQLGFCIFLHATWLATLAFCICLAKRLSVSVFSASLEVTFYFLFKPWLNIWGPVGLWPHLTRALPGALPGVFCFAPKSRTVSASPSSPTTQTHSACGMPDPLLFWERKRK